MAAQGRSTKADGDARSLKVKEWEFSYEARRSTRVILRIPCWITSRSSGESIDAWTLVINRHGARLQSRQAFIPSQKVGHALPNGRTAKGKVVWANPVPDLDGTFELAVELDETSNFFDISFPPQDQ